MCYFFKNKMPLKMEDCDLPTRPIRTNFFEIQGHEVVARHLYCKGKFKVLSQHANLPKLKLTWPSSWMRREALTIVKYSRHPRADARWRALSQYPLIVNDKKASMRSSNTTNFWPFPLLWIAKFIQIFLKCQELTDQFPLLILHLNSIIQRISMQNPKNTGMN